MKKMKAVTILVFLLAAAGWAVQTQPAIPTNSLGMTLLRIEPGTFPMGSAIKRDLWNEQPVHEVVLSQPFFISETEVTVEQFRQFQPDFEGTAAYRPFAAGMSWHAAVAFTEWLSRKEGKTYRLPTEAEWEFVARAGTDDAASQAKGRINVPNAWKVKNMLAGPREWCLDWFGEYPAEKQTDPVGPAGGNVKIVRGGTLDLEERNRGEEDFERPQARLAIAPAFGPFPKIPAAGASIPGDRPGLLGVWYRSLDFQNPQEVDLLSRMNNSWSNDPRAGGRWSARWRGFLEAPASGEVILAAEGGSGLTLELSGKSVLDSSANPPVLSAAVSMIQGRKYPVVISFSRSGGSTFRFFWEWAGQSRELIPAARITHTAEEEKQAKAEAKAEKQPGFHPIGFRVVLAAPPAGKPFPDELPYVRQGVKQTTDFVQTAPDMTRPYFRKRHLLPTPLENSPNEAIDALAFHPSFRRHNHSPGMEVMPNGDVFLVIYTSYSEYEPGVSLIAARLRFGAEEWDMPSRFLDFVGVNDHAPLAWTDQGEVRVFWGNPQMAEGGFPFQWTASRDNGATWDPIRFPNFIGKIGSHSPQPINTAFRGPDGKWYLSSDGSGGESVLWESPDGGKTWRDPRARSAGRHTSFALLKDGRILEMGGKNTHIDDFMPKAVSRDGGQSYEVAKTPFPRQGSNQRPTLIRLQSGRLLFAGDFVYHNDGSQPKGVNRLGGYVALSEDEGETWFIKPLIGVQIHEDIERAETMRGPTLGYAVARQAPNGMIHLIATMNNPCLHFEFNEAWIRDDQQGQRSDAELMASRATSIAQIRRQEERYPDGKPRIVWSGGVADDGRYLLEGAETWFYDNGQRQREATYRLGRKSGTESYWSRDGRLLWSWEVQEKGSAVWRQYRPSGRLKSESAWRGFKAHGPARLWDASGNPAGESSFQSGKMIK